MGKGDLAELIWKMECKGYDSTTIHFYISTIWNIIDLDDYRSLPVGYWQMFHYSENLAQAHIEIDFTGYKRSNYVLAL